MKNQTDGKESAALKTGNAKGGASAVQEKLAQALKANLKRRKQAESHVVNLVPDKNG